MPSTIAVYATHQDMHATLHPMHAFYPRHMHSRQPHECNHSINMHATCPTPILTQCIRKMNELQRSFMGATKCKHASRSKSVLQDHIVLASLERLLPDDNHRRLV